METVPILASTLREGEVQADPEAPGPSSGAGMPSPVNSSGKEGNDSYI